MHSFYSNKDIDRNYQDKFHHDAKYMTKHDIQNYYRYYNMPKKRGQLKKVIIFVFCLCFLSYIFVDYNLKTKLVKLKDRFDVIPRIDAEYNITQAYFINTLGCRMPYFNVTDENVIQFIFKPVNYTCKKALTRAKNNVAEFELNMNKTELLEIYNITDITTVHCKYTEIKRKTDQQNEYLREFPFQLDYNKTVQVEPGIEFICVECLIDSQTIYKDFHFFVDDKRLKNKPRFDTESSRKNKIISISKNLNHNHGPFSNRVLNNKSAQKSYHKLFSKTAERLSVMILGIDSVSHLNFLRQMRHTASYIHNNLEYVEFWGFNKVGDNTYPNLIPLLSGLDEKELNLSCLAPVKHENYDKCAFIWKRYKAAGFKTVYAEDVATLGLFNFFRPGFNRQPTDYYLRPIMLEMEQHISYEQSVNVQLCKGGRRTVDVVLELIYKLLPFMRIQDFFSFFWTVTLTHDLLNMPSLLDNEMVRLFKAFEATGIFNKTMIFLVSDHGLRWGSFRKTYQGMMEERQPLLIALYPKWFKEKYSAAHSNLELNSKRLTTHYDLHATMLDLLDLRELHESKLKSRALELNDADTMPRGMSLFLPVPETRSCDNAGIASHWCTCHHRQELQTTDARVQRAARFIIKLINERLKPYPKCRTLYLNSILEAVIAAPHSYIAKEVTNDYSVDITVRVETKPGLGLFESTVRMSNYSTALTGTISRINLYSSQSYCIDEVALKMFCYCHR